MGFAFTTCSEEISLQPSDPSGVEQAYPNEVLSAHWSVAKSLHTVINDRSDAYVSLIGALNDQFDDDYNVLLLNLRREVLDDSHKYEALAESLDQHEVSKILDDNPLWQIAIYNPTFDDVPLSFFKNDYQVAIVPSHIVDDRVPVIQKNGQRAFISGSNPPTVPTLYLSKNERIIGEKRLPSRVVALIRTVVWSQWLAIRSTTIIALTTITMIVDQLVLLTMARRLTLIRMSCVLTLIE